MKSSDLLQTIDSDRAAHLSFLQAFVQAPSPNPPGDTRAAADVITAYLKTHDITPEIIAPQPHMPNIVHDFTCRDANGYIDVFPIGSSAPDWSRDPWSGDIAHGRLHGRGTVDMRAGTAASVIAMHTCIAIVPICADRWASAPSRTRRRAGSPARGVCLSRASGGGAIA